MYNIFSRNKYEYFLPFHPCIDLRNRLPRTNLKKFNALYVGVGTGNSALGQQIPYLKFNRLDIIDIHQPYLNIAMARTYAAKEVNFINADFIKFYTDFYDIVLMFDILEHLPKKEALNKISKIFCKQIVFIPLEKEFRKNIYEAKSQDHLSIWTEEDFISRGYKTEILKDFHREDNKIFDALWALKN